MANNSSQSNGDMPLSVDINDYGDADVLSVSSAIQNKRPRFGLPVVAAGSEYLVMGYLMRRNILAYKAPLNNEGYDLICIHPDPRHKPKGNELAQIRVQVKSRYATDCDRSPLIKDKTLDAFDFLVVAFLNIGKFYGKHDGSEGSSEVEIYTLSNEFIREHHNASSSWQKVRLRGLKAEIEQYKGEKGFEQIAQVLGILKPRRERGVVMPDS